jgi:hypothetical protein
MHNLHRNAVSLQIPYVLSTASAVRRFVDNSRVAAISGIFLRRIHVASYHKNFCYDDHKRQQRRHTNHPSPKAHISTAIVLLFLCLGETAGVVDLCMALSVNTNRW